MTRNALVLAVLALGVAACGRKEIHAGDYDQACTGAEDCLVVIEGACTQCGYPCATGAINASERGRYQVDYRALGCGASNSVECSKCPVEDDSGVVVSTLSGPPTTQCVSGTCTAR